MKSKWLLENLKSKVEIMCLCHLILPYSDSSFKYYNPEILANAQI